MASDLLLHVLLPFNNTILAIKILPKVALEIVTKRQQPPPTLS